MQTIPQQQKLKFYFLKNFKSEKNTVSETLEAKSS